MQSTKLRVLKPEPEIHWVTEKALAARPDSLRGKKIGVLRYSHPSKSIDEAVLLAHVRAQSHAAEVTELIKEALAPWPQERLAAVARRFDAVIACSAQ